jgi:DHA1 family bicyclomycin/chloramphenicol resistance-like MFS transporter
MATVAADYRSLLGSRRFLGFAVGGGCATTSFYAFISTAPFTWTHELHRPLAEVGVYLGLMIAGVSAGNLVSNRLARRVDIDRLMVGSAALSLACAIVLLLLVYADALTAPRIGVAMFLFSAGGGMCSPAVMAKSLNVRPQVTGSAAGLYGCTQMVVGALCTSLAALGNNPTLSAAAVMTGAGVIGLLSFRIALRAERGAKHRD